MRRFGGPSTSIEPPGALVGYALPMRIGLAVSSNKFTGAAAVAEHWTRALHAVGVEARLLFVGGANLQRRLADDEWAVAGLRKERRPADVRSNFAALRRLAADADLVMTFLPHDHFEAVAAGVDRRTPLVRAFRSPDHLRRDVFHRVLARRCRAALAPFEAVVERTRRLIGGGPVIAPTVPVEDRFRPGPPPSEARRRLGIEPGRPILGMVGKLAAKRGFENLLDAAAHARTDCTVLVVGHGELQPDLERRARRLGLENRIAWAGKREDDLPMLFAAMDAVLFAAPGSDWGHRAISEAQCCGRPVIARPIDGVEDLLSDGRTGVVADDVRTIAAAFDRLVDDPDRAREIGEAGRQAADRRRFPEIGRLLRQFLEDLARAGGSTGGGPR